MLIKGDRKFRVNPPSHLSWTSVAVPTLRAKIELSAFPFSNNRATTSKMFKPSSFCLTGHHNPVTMTSEKLHGTNRQQSSTLEAQRLTDTTLDILHMEVVHRYLCSLKAPKVVLLHSQENKRQNKKHKLWN